MEKYTVKYLLFKNDLLVHYVLINNDTHEPIMVNKNDLNKYNISFNHKDIRSLNIESELRNKQVIKSENDTWNIVIVDNNWYLIKIG